MLAERLCAFVTNKGVNDTIQEARARGLPWGWKEPLSAIIMPVWRAPPCGLPPSAHPHYSPQRSPTILFRASSKRVLACVL